MCCIELIAAVLIPWVSGQMKDAPLETPFFPQVDAGDVATAAARALTKPAASGERFILCSGPTFNNDLAIVSSRPCCLTSGRGQW